MQFFVMKSSPYWEKENSDAEITVYYYLNLGLREMMIMNVNYAIHFFVMKYIFDWNAVMKSSPYWEKESLDVPIV